MDHTVTHTGVFANGPCGCRFAIPNDAYAEPVRLTPCPHGEEWLVAVTDDELRWAHRFAEDLARLFHASYEAIAPMLGYQTRRATAVPWDQLAPPSRWLMILTADQVLSTGAVVRGPGAESIGRPDQGQLQLEEPSTAVQADVAGAPESPGGDSVCRSCRAPILWREHVGTGRRAPIDATPDPAGNVVLVDPRSYTLLGAGDSPEVPRYTNHFQTCPNADRHHRDGR